jgi:hypothetical protein
MRRGWNSVWLVVVYIDIHTFCCIWWAGGFGKFLVDFGVIILPRKEISAYAGERRACGIRTYIILSRGGAVVRMRIFSDVTTYSPTNVEGSDASEKTRWTWSKRGRWSRAQAPSQIWASLPRSRVKLDSLSVTLTIHNPPRIDWPCDIIATYCPDSHIIWLMDTPCAPSFDSISV